MGGVVQALAFPRPPRGDSAGALRRCSNLLSLSTATGGNTPAVYIPGPTGSSFTLLCTHGNAEDLGELLDNYVELAARTKTSVFAVEYPGYSISDAPKPSERYCFEAVEAAYSYLVDEMRIPPGQVVAYGRSLGSGPAVHIASIQESIAGLVLQSPIESGVRCVLGRKSAKPVGFIFDIFRNYRKLPRVMCRTLVVHGTSDEVVPLQNGRNLYAMMERRGLASEPVWVEGHGHNDIPDTVVYQALKRFLAELPPPS